MTFTERIETRGDARFYVSDDGDLYVLREMYEMNVYRVTITPGAKVLDIGAHKGIFTVWAVRQGAVVTAYEPDPETYRTLSRNLSLNRLFVEALNCGVWSSSTVLPFYHDAENSIGSTFFSSQVNRSLPVESFDSVIGDTEWDVVKIDAEGAEYEMLLSSNRLGQIKHLALEWHQDSPELYRTVEKLRQFFVVPPVDPNWRILSMKQKSSSR